jgi:hypothetical protein
MKLSDTVLESDQETMLDVAAVGEATEAPDLCRILEDEPGLFDKLTPAGLLRSLPCSEIDNAWKRVFLAGNDRFGLAARKLTLGPVLELSPVFALAARWPRNVLQEKQLILVSHRPIHNDDGVVRNPMDGSHRHLSDGIITPVFPRLLGKLYYTA